VRLSFIITKFTIISTVIDAATLTCTGCTQPPNEADYYCPGKTQFLYFFCEAFDSAQLTWEIPNLISRPINFGAATESLNNVIIINQVTAILEEKVTNGGQIGYFSSHLWIDFGNVTSMELNITCKSSVGSSYKELLPLENILSPYEIYAVANTLDPRIDGFFVFYRWNHPLPKQVLLYETVVYEGNETIHRMIVPSAIMNATCQIEKTMCNNCYSVVVTAVDRCGQRSMNTTNIEIRVSDTRTVEVEDISKLTVALAVLILLPLPF
jgi:hypothetical protein